MFVQQINTPRRKNERSNQRESFKRTKGETRRLAKNENKTITQYIIDRCIVEDSYTDASNVDDASNRVETVLQEQIEQIRADFETERSFYVSQIEQKDKQIAEMLEINNNQLQLIGALTIKNETLLLETKKNWWQTFVFKKITNQLYVSEVKLNRNTVITRL